MNVPVIGNGMTLGMTNGSINFGVGLSSSAVNGLLGCATEYGASVGTGYSSWKGGNNQGIGVTTDPTKSGLITKFSGLTLGTVPSEKLGSFYIRY